MAYLTLVDRCWRGSVEAQFLDPFYGILALGREVSPIDVVLRGNAVTTAVATPDGEPALPLGGSSPHRLPDPRAGVRAMIDEGITVYVDEPSLRAFGLDAGSLLPGVTCLDSTELARRWSDYQQVWFL
jgi:intracellular sulfur oxidation DsrE/DsrF family protein